MSAARAPMVFGIGLNKTGTSSLHVALEALGYTGLHFAGPERSRLIRETIAAGEPMLSRLDPRYDAFTDVTPLAEHFYLADVQYPDAKFILTVRDLDDWLDSRRRHVEKNRERAAAGAYEGVFLEVDLETWALEYRLHEGAVRSYFERRPDALLVLDVTAGQGWEMLCDFLHAPIPDEPFPWENRYRPWRSGSEPATPRA